MEAIVHRGMSTTTLELAQLILIKNTLRSLTNRTGRPLAPRLPNAEILVAP
jgi:hypothetical protein